jgi:hypothetical protein
MQSQDDLPIPSEAPLNLKMFNARLTRSLIPASSCGFRLKDFELPIQDESEVQFYNLSVGLLQCSRSGVHRKVGNVALISPTGVPGLDQKLPFKCLQSKVRFRPIPVVALCDLPPPNRALANTKSTVSFQVTTS